MSQGVKATTMDDIAKYLGISKRTIYEHFTDKTDLLQNVFDFFYNKNLEEEKAVFEESENVLEALLNLIKIRKSSVNIKMVRTALELKRYYPNMFYNGMNKTEKLKKLEETFEQGIKEGVFRKDLNPKTSAFLFSEQARILFTEQFERIDFVDNIDISALQIIEDLFINFLRGISTPKGVDLIEKLYIKNK